MSYVSSPLVGRKAKPLGPRMEPEPGAGQLGTGSSGKQQRYAYINTVSIGAVLGPFNDKLSELIVIAADAKAANNPLPDLTAHGELTGMRAPGRPDRCMRARGRAGAAL